MAQKGYIKNSTTADLGAPELAAIFKGILPTSGIVDIFDDLACARVNDNLVRLSPGVYNLSGYILGVAQGTTADLAVDSGTAGYNRIDLLIAEFVRNGGGAGIDTLAFRILKGTSTTGTAVAPTLTQEDINGLGTTRQEALYQLNITGTTLAAPVLLADVVSVGQEFETTATNIKMNGTQSLGALETVARADHVHPSDTSRATQAEYTATIPYTSWTGESAPYSKAVTVSGILSTDKPILDVVMSGTYSTDKVWETNWGRIYRAITSANTITFYAHSLLTSDIPISVKVVR